MKAVLEISVCMEQRVRERIQALMKGRTDLRERLIYGLEVFSPDGRFKPLTLGAFFQFPRVWVVLGDDPTHWEQAYSRIQAELVDCCDLLLACGMLKEGERPKIDPKVVTLTTVPANDNIELRNVL